MDVKRKVAMIAATLAVALGAGHLMQNGLGGSTERVAMTKIPAKSPQAITPLAAGIDVSTGALGTPEKAAAPLPEVAFAPTPGQPATQQASEMEPKLTENIASPLPDAAALAENAPCPMTFEVKANAQATLDLTLIAPCRVSERVVLRHGGVTVTGMTSATGTLLISLPGMEADGAVSAFFNDGVEVSGAEPLPGLALYRRFGVQWVADDSFQLHAFEGGASYGDAGHVSAANPKRRLPNVPMDGGYLSMLGDSTAPLPMLAEVYTFPLDIARGVDLSIEAVVTKATCDRELLGELLLSEGGALTKTDLTLAMPDCDAVGDVLVLNNPLPDLRLVVAN